MQNTVLVVKQCSHHYLACLMIRGIQTNNLYCPSQIEMLLALQHSLPFPQQSFESVPSLATLLLKAYLTLITANKSVH